MSLCGGVARRCDWPVPMRCAGTRTEFDHGAPAFLHPSQVHRVAITRVSLRAACFPVDNKRRRILEWRYQQVCEIGRSTQRKKERQYPPQLLFSRPVKLVLVPIHSSYSSGRRTDKKSEVYGGPNQPRISQTGVCGRAEQMTYHPSCTVQARDQPQWQHNVRGNARCAHR